MHPVGDKDKMRQESRPVDDNQFTHPVDDKKRRWNPPDFLKHPVDDKKNEVRIQDSRP
jgi:hypothetical protein